MATFFGEKGSHNFDLSYICIPFPGCSIVLPRYCRNRVCKNKNQILFATPSPASHYQTNPPLPLIIKQNPPILHMKNRRIVLFYPFGLLAIFLSSLPLQASGYISSLAFRLLAIFTSSYPFTLPAVSPFTKNFWQEMKTMRIGSRLKTDRANT